jgi:hypothetical protein
MMTNKPLKIQIFDSTDAPQLKRLEFLLAENGQKIFIETINTAATAVGTDGGLPYHYVTVIYRDMG